MITEYYILSTLQHNRLLRECSKEYTAKLLLIRYILQCIFYFQNISYFYWSDQSPYAFQSWYSPVLNQAGYVIKLTPKRGIYGEYYSRKIVEFNPLNEVLQPSGKTQITHVE